MKNSSDHFDGHRYFNPHASSRSLWEVLIWRWKRKVKPWPLISIEQKKVQQARTKPGQCSVTFINHSTLLLQLEGWNILTDPIWSKRAGPFAWLGVKRVISPGVKFEDLPPIDLVLLSHNHYDHMDIPTLKKIAHQHASIFVVPKGNQAYLKAKGIDKQIIELDWWDHFDLSADLHITLVPAQHFSARGLFDRNRTLWGGFVIKGLNTLIYFAGDTGFGPHFAEIKERFGAPNLSLLPIGAYAPRWFMQPVHLSPQEAVEAHLILASKQSMGIHFGTFQLADEEIQSPNKELQIALKARHLPEECFWTLKPGESRGFD